VTSDFLYVPRIVDVGIVPGTDNKMENGRHIGYVTTLKTSTLDE